MKIIKKRNHITGNHYDYIDENKILVSKYGAHLFHTNEKSACKDVNQLSNWYSKEHRVIARVEKDNTSHYKTAV